MKITGWWMALICLTFVFRTGSACAQDDPSAQIPVDAKDQACLSDEDCVMIRTKCLPCECDASVHRDYLVKYQQILDEACAKFVITDCKLACKTPVPRCVEGECTLMEK